jgi:hypothetical protein
MQNHLKTAREWGSQQALERVGYKTAADVEREAIELGLIETPKTAAVVSNSPLAALFRPTK